MHEILFRGKSLNSGEWVEGSLVHRTQYYGDPDDSWYILTSGEFDYDYYDAEKVQDNTVGEYTGLTDKNGKRIFEGDIVTLNGGNYEVRFDNGRFHISGTCYPSWNSYNAEVVGNVHDNPELIGDGE